MLTCSRSHGIYEPKSRVFVVTVQKPPGMKEEDEPEEEEEEELGHAETYAEYMPMKCTYNRCVGGAQIQINLQ